MQTTTASQSSATQVTLSFEVPMQNYTSHQLQITGMGTTTCTVMLMGVADQFTSAGVLANDHIMEISGVYKGMRLDFSGAGTATIKLLSYNTEGGKEE